jgi:hypothetical protein
MAPLTALSALLFTLPLTALAPTGDELRLEARQDGTSVRAVLTNTSSHRIKVFVGYSCEGRDSYTHDSAPFSLEIDGQRRPPLECVASNREAQFRTLAPGATYEIGLALAHEEEQGVSFVVRYQPPRRFRDCFKKPLVTQARPWPETLALSLKLTPQSGGAVELEIEHRNTSPSYMTAFVGDACDRPIFDALLVDGAPHPLFPPAACAGVHPSIKTLPPGGSFTTRARLQLAPGTHTLQATYQTLRSQEFTLMLGGISSKIGYGHMTWRGTARSAATPVEVK